MKETTEQAKAMVYATEVAAKFRQFVGRCTELKLDFLARAYSDAAERLEHGAAVQMQLFREPSTLFEQSKRVVIERDNYKRKQAHDSE